MRRTLAILTIPFLAVAVGCSSSSRSRAPAQRTPMFTSITSTSASAAGGWTTPASETVNSGSPPGPVTYARAPAQPAQPSYATPGTTSGWDQPPVMDDFPQPPPTNMPAEPTWTAPAPQPGPEMSPFDGPAPADAAGFPAPAPDAPVPDAPIADAPDANAAIDAAKEAASAAGVDAKAFEKAGFATILKDDRLWVFREGSDDLAKFLETGAPAKSVLSDGMGPGGLSLGSGDIQVIKDYLAAP